MTIRIFVTGGTFDKEYDELTGRLFFQDSHVAAMLKQGRCRIRVELRLLMMVDSLEMTDEDRDLILRNCEKTPESRIVITHGTDTMVETARLLGQNMTDKTVVLTGAMKPYAFGSSDGMFNLGSALSFVQVLPPGVYICMNGCYFSWDNCRKNSGIGFFAGQFMLSAVALGVGYQLGILEVLILVFGAYVGMNTYAYVFGGAEQKAWFLLGLITTVTLIVFPTIIGCCGRLLKFVVSKFRTQS